MKAINKLILVLIPTIILLIYAIELGIRVLFSNGKAEYLVIVTVIIIILLIAASRFYRNYLTEKER
ncbi:MAG: hypothetical protein P8X91_00010 [Candidatus Bathyarchaeota archaeon]